MPRLRDILYASSLLFPLYGVAAVSGKLLDRAHRFVSVAVTDFLGYIIGHVLVAVPMALLGFGVWSLVGAQLATAAVRSLFLFRAQPHRLRLRIKLAVYFDLMRQGTAYTIQRFSNIVSLKGDYFVIGRMLNPSALGEYERAYVLMNLSNSLLMGPLNRVLFPAFARIQDDHERIRRAYLRSTALVALFFLPASTVCVILGREIVLLLLGDQWEMTVLPFQILAAGLFFRTGYKVSAVAMNGIGQVYRSSVSQVVYAILVVGGAFLFIRWGIVGVAISTVVAIAAVHVMLTGSIMHAVSIKSRDLMSSLLPAIFLSVVTAAIAGGVAEALRAAGAPSLLVLGAATLACTVVLALLLLLFPKLLGQWSRDTISGAARSMKLMLARRGLPSGWLGRLAA
jgi:PST family polysaccharide transporter